MSYEVRKHIGAGKWVIGGYADAAEAQAAAVAACDTPGIEYVLFDEQSNELGRAVWNEGKAEWRGPGGVPLPLPSA